MNNSKKAQDILKARVIATGMSVFFLVMGFLTVCSRHYSLPVELNDVRQVMLSQVDFYMGLVQMSLGLLPLTIWFNSNQARLNWSLLSIALAVIFFVLMYSKMVI